MTMKPVYPDLLSAQARGTIEWPSKTPHTIEPNDLVLIRNLKVNYPTAIEVDPDNDA